MGVTLQRPEVMSACVLADLNSQSLPSLSASRIFYGNGQLALVDRHIALVLQLPHSLHDVSAQLLGLLHTGDLA